MHNFFVLLQMRMAILSISISRGEKKTNKCILIVLSDKGNSTTTLVKFYPILNTYPLEWTIMDILHITYPLFTWSSLDFLLTTYLSLLVHVVIECPLSVQKQFTPKSVQSSKQWWQKKLDSVFLRPYQWHLYRYLQHISCDKGKKTPNIFIRDCYAKPQKIILEL